MAAHTDLSIVSVGTAPSPATSGTTVVVTDANAANLPNTYPWWGMFKPAGSTPTRANAEMVKVTAGSSSGGNTTYTIVRAQGNPATSARTVIVGDDFYEAVAAQDIIDLESALVSSQVKNEVPGGSVNSSNTAFTTAAAFQTGSLRVFKNGLRLKAGGVDFTEGSQAFTMVTAPDTGDLLLVDYDTNSTAFAVGSASWVYNETPAGTIDGANATFTLASAPVAGSLQLFRDGQLMKGGSADYSISSLTITMTTAPASGSVLLAYYQSAVSSAGNADMTDGIHANATPTASNLLPLDSNTNFPVAVDRHFIHRNALINSGMQVHQRQSTPSLSTSYQYVLDRWAGKAGGTVSAGTMGQVTSSSNVGSFGNVFKFIACTLTGSGEIRLRYRMEAKDAVKFKNLTGSFAIKVYQDTGGAINYVVYIRKPTTTADTFSAVTDISNSGNISVPNTTATTIKYENISLGDVSFGIEIEIVASCGAITTKNFEFTEAVFNKGATALDAQPVFFDEVLHRCLRFFQKSFDYTVAPAQNTANQSGCFLYNNFSTINTAWVPFQRRMRVAPTVTYYNPNAANNSWRDIDNNADRATTADAVSEIGHAVRSGAFAGTAVRNLIHWSADAEL